MSFLAIMCDVLPDINNGGVELNGRFVGATATYSCINGYILEGESQRTCQVNGQWSDSEPFCRSKNLCQIKQSVNLKYSFTTQFLLFSC